jgi:hypothetical protein
MGKSKGLHGLGKDEWKASRKAAKMKERAQRLSWNSIPPHPHPFFNSHKMKG